MAGAGDVTILCDDFDGIVVLPDYNRFRRVFEAEQPDLEVPQWRELVWAYINDPDIPIVAFERVAEDLPVRVESVLRELLDDKTFSLEHLYAVLLHYKQPVEGLDELDDDRQLWDLFNGNAPSTQKPGKAKAKPNKKTAASRGDASARKSTAGRTKKTRGVVAKANKSVAAKRAAARPTPKMKNKPAAKSAAGRKPASRSINAGKGSQTRKR
jgi:hypothetical protein